MTIPDMNPLGYTGLKQRTPANAVHYTRDPTVNDWQAFDIGDLWVNTTTLSGFQLMSKAKNPLPPHNRIARWEAIGGGGIQVRSLQPDVGAAVIPTGGIIDIVGANGIITNNTGVSTLEVFNGSTLTADDTNTIPFVGGTIPVTGDIVQGIETSITAGELLITAHDASNASKGVSQYDATQFNVAAGVVTLTGSNTTLPAFLAYQASDANNATGNGTVYTLGSTVDLTEVFDQGNNFDHTTGTFTAPITGKYMVSYGIRFSNVSGTMSIGVSQLVSSNRTYRSSASCVFNTAVASEYGQQFSALIDMDAGDTFTVNALIVGGAGNTATIAGSATGDTFISGYLVC